MLAKLSCGKYYEGGKLFASLISRVPASLVPRRIKPVKTGNLVAVKNIHIVSYFSQHVSHDHEHYSRIFGFQNQLHSEKHFNIY